MIILEKGNSNLLRLISIVLSIVVALVMGAFIRLSGILEKHPADSRRNLPIHEPRSENATNLPTLEPENSIDEDPENSDYEISFDEIKKIINISICKLTYDVGLPHSKISEFVKVCEGVVNNVAEYLEKATVKFMRLNQTLLSTDQTIELRNLFQLNPLFDQVNTFKKQSEFLEKLAVSVPVPRDILLSRREDIRHVNAIPRKVLVNETASYISIIDTLKLIFRNPENREHLNEAYLQSESTPCVTEYSSFRTGETFKASEASIKMTLS